MENYSFDLQRIFLGDLPLLFLLEIVFRTVFIYGYTAILLRLSPRRNLGNMTQFEVILIIALGSAVGDPMLYPEVPLMHCMLVIALVLSIQYIITRLTNHTDHLEGLIEGDPMVLVEAGLLQVETMERAHVSREDVMGQLRLKGVGHIWEKSPLPVLRQMARLVLASVRKRMFAPGYGSSRRLTSMTKVLKRGKCQQKIQKLSVVWIVLIFWKHLHQTHCHPARAVIIVCGQPQLWKWIDLQGRDGRVEMTC